MKKMADCDWLAGLIVYLSPGQFPMRVREPKRKAHTPGTLSDRRVGR